MKRRDFLKLVAAAAAIIPLQAAAKPVFDVNFFAKKNKNAQPIQQASKALDEIWQKTSRFEYIPIENIEWINESSFASNP